MTRFPALFASWTMSTESYVLVRAVLTCGRVLKRGIVASVIGVGLFAGGCLVGKDGSKRGDPSGDPSSGDPNDPSSGDPNDPSSGDMSYSWIAGDFGPCSVACGGGVQSRPVACLRGDGVVVDDSLCTTPKPEEQLACNAQSCTNTNCNPVYVPGAVTPVTPSTGPAPLTVTFNLAGQSTFRWDSLDFGDGSAAPSALFQWKLIPNYGYYACVNHVYTLAGTFSVGRHPVGSTSLLQEATVQAN
jgi:hypothetical protein